MVHHPMLKYQIEKFLGEHPELAPVLNNFLGEIDRTYQKFESDRARLKKDAFSDEYIEDPDPSNTGTRSDISGVMGSDEQFFKRIVEATTEPIAVFAPTGELFLTNEAFNGLFALSEHANDSNFIHFLQRTSAHAFSTNILSALEQGGSWEGLLEAVHDGDDTFPLWFRGDAILDDTGSILFIIGIMHDASGQDLVERTLTAYQNSGQTVDMHKGSYAALQQIADAVGKQSALLQCILDIAWLKDADGKYQAVNRVFCKWFGLEEIDVIGRTDAELLPEYTARMMATTDTEVTRQRRLLRKEVAVQGSDGKVYWCELIKVPSFSDSGAVTGIAGIMRDISITKEDASTQTERRSTPVSDFMKSAEFKREKAEQPFESAPPKRQEEPPTHVPVTEERKGKHDLQQRDAIMAAINLAAEYFLRVPPWEKHIQEVLEWLGRAVNVSRVYLYQNIRETAGKIQSHLRYEWRASGIASNLNREELQHFDFEDAGFGRWVDAMQSGDIILGNVKDFPEPERRHFASLGTTSLVAVPILVDGSWWGYLGFEECVIERDWKPIIIDVLKTSANLIGAVIERERTEGTYRTMVEHSLQELLIAQNGRIVYANPEAIRNSGVSEQDFYRFGATDMYENVLEEDSPIVSQALATLKSGSKDSVRVEFRERKHDNSIRWLESLMSIVSYKGSPAIQIVQLDITDRRKAESVLQNRSSLEHLIGDLSTRFIHLSYESLESAISAALELLGEYYHADRCVMFLNNETGNTGSIAQVWNAVGIASISNLQQTFGILHSSWMLGELDADGGLLIDDVRSLPVTATEEKSLFANMECRSVAIAPMRIGEVTIGCLMLCHSEKVDHWSNDVISGLSLVSDIIANALQREKTEASLLQTRERYTQATEAGSVGVWDLDLRHNELFIDTTLKQMLGYADHELPNDLDEWMRHIHPDDTTDLSKRIADSRAGRIDSYSTEIRMVHREGHVEWFMVNGKVIRNDEGEPVRILGTDTRITDLKKTESALRDAELQNRAIIDSLPDVVYVVNADGLITTVLESDDIENNVQFRSSPLNKNVYDVLSRNTADQFVKTIRTVLQTGETSIVEYDYYDSISEKVYYFEARLARLHSDAVLVITREITTRKQSELALIDNNETLKIRNEELDAFSHTVAHDLKNPLTLVIGYAGLLNEAAADMKPSEVKQYLSNILLNSKRMNSIIESLLLLAEVRQEDVDLDELDMKFIVDESLSRLSYMIQEYMAVVVLPDEWPVSVGYSSWVEEVWVNYITNAMKYGGRPPKIELGADRNLKGYIRYWVKDNGKGIASEDVERLFSPLTRLGSGTIKGYGLGLSIVKRIVEKLHGKIGVDSEIGKGSTFWFALPEHSEENG